jgi:DNA primase
MQARLASLSASAFICFASFSSVRVILASAKMDQVRLVLVPAEVGALVGPGRVGAPWSVGRAAPTAGPAVPKYLNTRDTVIYHKGRILYGLAEQATRLAAGWAPVLVEGSLDVLAVWLAHRDVAGVGRAALATCGSILTPNHVATVCGLPGAAKPGITTCFNHDDPGLDATIRAWRTLPTTIDRYAATLPAGTDPADHVTGPLGALRSALKHRARPLTETVLDIHLDQMLARHIGLLDHVDGRVQAAQALAELLVNEPPIEVAGVVVYLAARTRVTVGNAVQVVTDALDRWCDRPSGPSNA